MTPRVLAWITCCSYVLAAQPLYAQVYRVIDLGSLEPGNSGNPSPAIPADIDSTGRVVGRAPGEPGDRAFLWKLGAISDLGSIDPRYVAAAGGINDTGVVAGWSTVESQIVHAVVWAGNQLVDLGTLGGQSSEAVAINRQNWVVGWSHREDQLERGFLYRNNQMIDIGTLPGGFESGATAIDSFGRVAGWSQNSSGRRVAIIWENNLMATIGTLPGARDSFAEAMNDRDQIVGSSDMRAFLFEGDFTGGTMTELPGLGGNRSFANDINNDGVIVGTADVPGMGLQPCIWIEGQIHDLNDLIAPYSGWTVTSPRAINDAGYIAALALRDTNERGVLLAPTPIHLSPPSPGRAGEVNTFTASGATPGSAVRLIYGTQRGFSHPAGCPAAIVDMKQSFAVATATADQNGEVVFELPVPGAVRGRIFILQLVEPQSCFTSQPVTAVFQ